MGGNRNGRQQPQEAAAGLGEGALLPLSPSQEQPHCGRGEEKGCSLLNSLACPCLNRNDPELEGTESWKAAQSELLGNACHSQADPFCHHGCQQGDSHPCTGDWLRTTCWC